MSKRSGDPCEQPHCGGKLKTYSTHIRGDRRVRYLRCAVCRCRPRENKWIVPLICAPAR